jgi:hypothetical protein
MSQAPQKAVRQAGQLAGEEPAQPVDLFTRTNERSLINLLPPEMQQLVWKAAKDREDLFKLDERELKKIARPTPTDNRLRLAFWTEYNRVQEQGEKRMFMVNVYAGICTHQNFYGRYLAYEHNVAWLLTPPSNYVAALNEMLVVGQDNLRQVLEVSPVDAQGEVNLKLAELQLKIYLAVELRTKGAVAQRIDTRTESKNFNVNVNADQHDPKIAQAVKEVSKAESLDDINRKIALLEEKERAALRKQLQPPVRGDVEIATRGDQSE